MAKLHSTETQSGNVDLLDLIDGLHKELASLKTIHELLHCYLKSALISNDLQKTRKELRVFNCGLENLFNPSFSRAGKLLDSLKKASL